MQKLLVTGAVAALLATAIGAQTAQGAVRLIKLPNGDYTVPMSELEGSGTNGTVTMHPQGPKTIVTVTVNGTSKHMHSFKLHPGSDCSSFGAANSITLAPALTGQPSRTIVSLPITNLTSSDYVVAARDATTHAQFQESCAHI